MVGSISQLAFFLGVAGIIGAVAGFFVSKALSSRRIEQLADEAAATLSDLHRQRQYFGDKLSRAQSSIESLQTDLAMKRREFDAVTQKSNILTKNVLALRTERENTKVKVTTLQKSLVSVKQQTLALQREFEKAGAFYKGELVKSFDKRKALEQELEKAQSEQESFAKLVESAVLEHGDPKEMITEAKLRLGQLQVLERTIEKLEQENQQLRDEAVNLKRDYDALQKDLKELDELKIYNKQLVECVESLESSRQQHEQDAEMYRSQAAESDQLSDTLRLKLEDLEQNFADIEKQQHEALEHARDAATPPASNADEYGVSSAPGKERKAG